MGKNKRISIVLLSALFALSLSLFLVSCGGKPEDGGDDYTPSRTVTTTKVVTYDGPGLMESSPLVGVKVEDKDVFVYETRVNHNRVFSYSYSKDTAPVALFDFDGRVRVEIDVRSGGTLSEAVVRPLSYGVEPRVEGSKITFTLDYPAEYSVEYKDSSVDRPASENAVLLFANEIESDPVTAETADANTLYIGPGVWMASAIPVRDNTTVYLAGGAYVYGQIRAEDVSNLTIRGRGILAGDLFDRRMASEYVLPIELRRCTNVKIEDISILDPAGWAITLYHCKDVDINDIKIVTARANGDGISVQSSENVKVMGGFVRTWDDSLVVKNAGGGRTRNVVFDNVTVWTDLAQSCEVGYETNGDTMDDISFKNITIVHNFHKAAMSIHNADQAVIKNVNFLNITLEDGQMLGDVRLDGLDDFLIDLTIAYSAEWSQSGAERGVIDGVHFSNIKVLSLADSVICRMLGESARSDISNVTIDRVEIMGREVKKGEDLKLATNDYVKAPKISGGDASGATVALPYKLELADENVKMESVDSPVQTGLEVPPFSMLDIEPSYIGVKTQGISQAQVTHGHGRLAGSAVWDDQGGADWSSAGKGAANLTDGNKDTAWLAREWTGVEDEFVALSFRFDAAKTVGTIRLFGDSLSNHHDAFSIGVFALRQTEGQPDKWVTSVSALDYSISPLSGNYVDVKIAVKEYTGLQLRIYRKEGIAYPQSVSFGEAEFYPASLTTNKSVTGTEHEDVYKIGNVVDGDNSSYYESKNETGFPATITVDMGQSYAVKYINIHLPSVGTWVPRTQTIQILGSTDGTNFTTVAAAKAYTFDPATGNRAALVLDAPADMRYIRLVYTSNTAGYGAQISELYVYGE